jgi:radical SAM protein with 4Fe4S-binding SPASM domain
MQVSVGIGITNDCNLDCAHCYRPQDRVYQLSLEDIRGICQHLDVSSMNLGTGESWMHPDFTEIVEYLAEQQIKVSMASNGYSLASMPATTLELIHDVEVSIDFATPQGQDAFRGDGSWACIMSAIERCRNQGLDVTILTTMMSTNYDQMDSLVHLAGQVGANLRANVYQPVQEGRDRFMLDYEQLWEGFQRLLDSGPLLSTSEPIVHAMLGLDTLQGSPCGRKSVRFTPQGHITPCVYWPYPDLTLDDLEGLTTEAIVDSPQFRQARLVPPECEDCPHVLACGGGCASRRALLGNLDQADIYCPLIRGERVQLSFTPASEKDLPRGSNVCTTIIVP